MKKQNEAKQKTIIYFVLFQLLICMPCFLLYDAAKIATENNTQTAVFYADSVEVAKKSVGDNRTKIYIYHDTTALNYYFSNDIKQNEANLDFLRSQQLTIRYFPKNGIVVDIHGEEKEFYTMDSYNEARRVERIAIICVFVILEIIYGIVLFLYSLTTSHGYKFFNRMRKNIRSKKKSKTN